MEKTAYSDEDIKDVLRTLFAEKKKVKELQDKVHEIGAERNRLEEELGDLRHPPFPKAPDAQILTLDDPRLLDRLEALKQRIQQTGEVEASDDPVQLFRQCALGYQRQISELKDGLGQSSATQGPLSEENTKLKRLVAGMKKKYEHALRQAKTLVDQKELALSEALERAAAIQEADCTQVVTESIATLHSQLEGLSSENSHLQDAIQEARTLTSCLEQECQKPVERLNNLEAELEEAQQALLEAQKRCQVLEAEQTDLIKEASEIKGVNVHELQRNLDKLQAGNIDLRNENDKLSRIARDTETTLHAVQGELEGLHSAESKTNMLAPRLEAAELQCKQLQEQLSEAEQRCTSTESTSRSHEQELHLLQKEIIRLQQKLGASEGVSASELQELTQEKQRLATDLECVRLESAEHRAKLNEVKELLKASHDKQLQVKQQSDKLLERLGAREKRISELEEFEYSYGKVNEQKQQSERSLQELRSALRSSETEKDQLSKELNRMRQRAEGLEVEVTSQCQSADSHDLRRQSLESQLEVQTIRCRELAEEIECSQEELSKLAELQADYAASQQHEIEMEQKCASLEELLSEKITALAESAELEANLRGELTQLTAHLDARSTQLNELQREIEVIKQTLVRSVRETKELELRYLDSVGEKVNTITRCRQLEHRDEQRSNELAEVQTQLHKTQSAKEQLQTRIEDLQVAVDSSRAHAQSLQNRIASLDADAQSHELECSRLQQAALHAEQEKVDAFDVLDSLRQSNQLLQDDSEKLSERVQQSDLALQIVSQEKRLLLEAQEEMLERERLLQEEVRRMEDQFTEAQSQEEALLEKVALLEEAMAQAESHYAQAARSHQESLLSLEEQVEALQVEANEGQRTQRSLSELEEKYDLLRDDYEATQLQLDESLEASGELEGQLHQVAEEASSKTGQLNRYTQILEETQVECQQLKEQLKDAEMAIGDGEEALKVAQQHLAKKVKEGSCLSDAHEKLKAQKLELEKVRETQDAKVRDLGENLNLQRQQEKKLQELLNESIKSAESQVTKWEKKYFESYDKWQEGENRNKDQQQEISSLQQQMQQLEEKHRQVTSLLSKLGTFLGNPFGMTPNQDLPSTGVSTPTPAELAALASGMQMFGEEMAAPSSEPVPAPAPQIKPKLEFGQAPELVPASDAEAQNQLFTNGDSAAKQRSKRNLFE